MPTLIREKKRRCLPLTFVLVTRYQLPFRPPTGSLAFFSHPMIRPLILIAALSLLSACDKQPVTVTKSAKSAPKATESKMADAKPASASAPAKETKFPEAVDIGGFGSAEPVERKDMPTRGIIAFGPGDYEHSNGAHWETYAWTKFKAKRFGRYNVRLTYTLKSATLGMQFRLGDLAVKKTLHSAYQPTKTYLGGVYIARQGDLPFSMLTAPAENAGFTIHEIALIPATEGGEIKQVADGVITLNAKDATTWSETLRYEPKTEKNCLGYWTDPADFAEWEFQVTKPGRYKVSVFHGCGGGNHGSDVEIKLGNQALKFTTLDTGGFQNWKEVPVGEIEIKAAGTHRLMIDPLNKVKSAVLDVQKIVLIPAS